METWDEILCDLRDGYVRDSLKRLERMARQLSLLESEAGNDELLYELRREFHGMTGSGTSYGFPALTDIGREGEHEVLQHLARGGPATLEERHHWNGLVVQARTSLAASPAN